MLQPDDSTYSTLSLAQFRERMQRLVRFGYPVTDQRSLLLTEIQYADIQAYVLAVQPCSDAALDQVIRQLVHEWETLRVELDTARLAEDRQQLDYLYNRLHRLGRYQSALDRPLAAIEAYPDATGSYLAFINRYVASVPPKLRGQDPFPEFADDFLTLTDFVKKRICRNRPDARPAGGHQPVEHSRQPGRKSEEPYDYCFQLILDGLSRDDAFEYYWEQLGRTADLSNYDRSETRNIFNSAMRRRWNKHKEVFN